jgi:hypothetical protein
MSIQNFLKTYIPRALIAAAVYCIAVVIFLSRENYQSIWILFLGNVLYMLSITVIVYLTYRADSFKESPVTSAISGHILSFTGAALSVILSLLLYFLYDLVIRGSQGETLQNAPAGFSSNSTHGMLFVLVILAAFGNTVAGFFAALFTSFDASKKQADNLNN